MICNTLFFDTVAVNTTIVLKSIFISLFRFNRNDFPLFNICLYFSKVGLKNENFLAVFMHMTVDSRSETLHRFMSLAIAAADHKLINSTQRETDILDDMDYQY